MHWPLLLLPRSQGISSVSAIVMEPACGSSRVTAEEAEKSVAMMVFIAEAVREQVRSGEEKGCCAW
jgi:hypothetical protein